MNIIPSADYCFIIPCYNHGNTIVSVLNKLASYQLHCFIIDDGSKLETAEQLQQAAALFPWVSLITLSVNQGKGGAVMAGLEQAQQHRFQYAIQIDADGQHNCDDIIQLIETSRLNPNCLISGWPQYDDSVPKHRLISRYITHFWVWVETLSFSIKDSMCGFRVYPINSSLQVINSNKIGRRMDFDTEILVRLYWAGIESIFIKTDVIYPKNGVSHFNLVKDNLLISWMHTKLFFAMLPRSWQLVKRNYTKKISTHWSQTQERKGLGGIKFILGLYRIFGRSCANVVMYPVIFYFWLTGSTQRKASKQYLNKIIQRYEQVPLVTRRKLTTLHHFYRFGDSMLDKLASWQGDIKLDELYYPNQQRSLELIKNKQGIILLGSHLGDLEMCRALAQLSHDVTINALVFTQHALRFNQVLKEVNPSSVINLIQVDSLSADTAILLQQKLQAGEWVAIVGDRTSSNPHHRNSEDSVVWAPFLGEKAPFPKGPFVLSAVLGFPVYLIWGLKPNGRFQLYFEHFSDQLILPRHDRQSALQNAVEQYAKRLEYHCLVSPLDWFNFYNFWHFTPPKQDKKKDD